MTIILLILFSILLRLIPHIPNIAPVTAIALFTAVRFEKRYSFFIPFIVMLLSDYLLLYITPYPLFSLDLSRVHSVSEMFHATTVYVWGSFLLSAAIGQYIKKRASVYALTLAAVLCSVQFYLITNFGVWAATDMYPPTFPGLMQSYVMAIPFFRLTLVGDLIYTGLLFGSYECITRFRCRYEGRGRYYRLSSWVRNIF